MHGCCPHAQWPEWSWLCGQERWITCFLTETRSPSRGPGPGGHGTELSRRSPQSSTTEPTRRPRVLPRGSVETQSQRANCQPRTVALEWLLQPEREAVLTCEPRGWQGRIYLSTAVPGSRQLARIPRLLPLPAGPFDSSFSPSTSTQPSRPSLNLTSSEKPSGPPPGHFLSPQNKKYI